MQAAQNISSEILPEITTLCGEIMDIRFHSPDSGYTIARVELQGPEEEQAVVVAHIPDPKEGELYAFSGKYVENPKYGRQFIANYVELRPPVTESGIKAYLSSGISSNVGSEIAQRIVDAFGLDTLNVIENNPERLRDVNGVGPIRAEAIVQAFREHTIMRESLVSLYSMGLSSNVCAKIFKKYGVNALDKIFRTPYQLTHDIPGFSFKIADRVALKAGISPTATERIRAGIFYVLEQAVRQGGHTYLGPTDLLRECMSLLDISDYKLIGKNVSDLEKEEKVVIERPSGKTDETTAVYLPYMWKAEHETASLLSFFAKKNRASVGDPDKVVRWMKHEHDITLSPEQVDALRLVSQRSLCIITGGPGTGKTTLLLAILRLFEDRGIFSLFSSEPNILCVAPTGKASRRMSESTGHDSYTVHRALGWNHEENKFLHDHQNPLECDVLVCDEGSMLELRLFNSLLKAVPAEASIILLGDAQQLAPVAAGCPFKDMINSGVIPTVKLQHIFRQGERSEIVMAAHDINNGIMPDLDKNDGEFVFIEKETPEQIKEEIIKQITKEIPEKYGFETSQIQCLSPMHKPEHVGIKALNLELQKILNPHGRQFKISNVPYRVSDVVMQIRNNYDLGSDGVMNGQLGVIIDHIEYSNHVYIQYDDEVVRYMPEDMDNVIAGFVFSVHKSQGSEFDIVLIPVHSSMNVLLSRTLMYTGITRGRKLVMLIGSKKALKAAIDNNKAVLRYSRLDKRLREMIQGN